MMHTLRAKRPFGCSGFVVAALRASRHVLPKQAGGGDASFLRLSGTSSSSAPLSNCSVILSPATNFVFAAAHTTNSNHNRLIHALISSRISSKVGFLP
jgi:hypothetical protein